MLVEIGYSPVTLTTDEVWKACTMAAHPALLPIARSTRSHRPPVGLMKYRVNMLNYGAADTIDHLRVDRQPYLNQIRVLCGRSQSTGKSHCIYVVLMLTFKPRNHIHQ